MLTENNFFTHIQKWSACKTNLREPPKFFRQSFDITQKTVVPYDELQSWKKDVPIENLIPHFFIEDSKQTCFADNPKKHSDILDSCYAVFSPDYSVFTNGYSQFNNASLLLNRLIASYWQNMGRYVILTLSWAWEDTYDTAFSNIEKGCTVAISTEGVNDWSCFKIGFLEMLKRLEPYKICWYDKIPDWVHNYFDENNIISIQKRHRAVKERELEKIFSYSFPF